MVAKVEEEKKAPVVEEPAVDKKEVEVEAKTEVKPEAKPEAKPDPKPEANKEVKMPDPQFGTFVIDDDESD